MCRTALITYQLEMVFYFDFIRCNEVLRTNMLCCGIFKLNFCLYEIGFTGMMLKISLNFFRFFLKAFITIYANIINKFFKNTFQISINDHFFLLFRGLSFIIFCFSFCVVIVTSFKELMIKTSFTQPFSMRLITYLKMNKS